MESKSIDYVAGHERHGRVVDQATFWFLGNFHFFTIAIGFVGPSMGLGLGATALAGGLGILFGTLFVAFHASQGAELGLPQMIQSRAQFGFRGVIVVLVGTLFTSSDSTSAAACCVPRACTALWAGTRLPSPWSPSRGGGARDLRSRLAAPHLPLVLLPLPPLYTLLSVSILAGRVPATHLAGSQFTWAAFAGQFAASAS